MSENGNDPKHLVAVVGAGPAGLYASRELVAAGCRVALFNRDVKPGGLAEYGIFHSKIKMKTGLRKQFASILDDPNVEYYGNIVVGEEGDLSLRDLVDLGFQAILVTVGAQGTKWLGLPGEDLEGVYHAKDVVYHYNHLPPFSQMEMKTGERLLIIGIGNVMCDIAHWAVRDLGLKEVGAIVRRGPGQAKFTPKEWQVFARNMDLDDFEAEWGRCVPKMEAVGEDVEAARTMFMSGVEKGKDPISDTRFFYRFFHSPKGMIGEDGKCVGLEVEETYLEDHDGYLKAIGTGNTQVIECDSVVFCIGDKVDDTFGLPTEWGEYVKSPEPRYPVEETSYEAHDPEGERDLSNIFVAGWSRKASDGLVGVARKDGTNGANALMQYLAAEGGEAASTDTQALKDKLAALDKKVVVNADIPKLFAAEAKVAEDKGVEEFKYDSNEEMLSAIAG